MRTQHFLFLFFFLFIASCSEDPYNLQGFDDPNNPNCIDCGDDPVPGVPATPIPPSPPTPPEPPTISRYELGKATGITDADNIFHNYFDMHNKYERICGGSGTQPDDPSKWTPDYPPYSVCQEDITCNYDYSKIKVCYTESYNGAQSDFSQHVIDYRNNIQYKIDNFQDRDFNRGLLYGLNYQLARYNVNYGILVP